MKKYITSKPNVMGGAPCIVGTRIPMEVILYRLKEGVSIKELYRMYPWVDKGKFEGALKELADKVYKLSDDQEVSQTQAATG